MTQEFTPEQQAKIQKYKTENYGQEVVVDLQNVPPEVFNLATIQAFASDLCEEIGMNKGPFYNWGTEEDNGKYADEPKKDGISVVQFLWESSITIHALDLIQKVFINVFSCKAIDVEKVREFSLKRLGGDLVSIRSFERY